MTQTNFSFPKTLSGVNLPKAKRGQTAPTPARLNSKTSHPFATTAKVI